MIRLQSRRFLRRVRLVTSSSAIIGCALGLTACRELPTGKRISDGPAIRRAISAALGVDLDLAPTVYLPVGIADQAFSYYGESHQQIVLVVVFDREKAVHTVIGPRLAARPSPPTRLLTYSNVVVFYTRTDSAPDQSRRILQSLRRTL